MLLWLALAAYAAPAHLPLHGRLAESDGAPVDERVRLVVALYDSALAPTPVWSDTFSVVPVNGSFTAELGSGALLDTDLFQAHSALWVGVTVADDVEMPRFPLGGAHRAARAEHAPDAAAVGDRTLDSLDVTAEEVVAAAQAVCLDSPEDVRALLDDDYRAIDDPLDWSELQGIPTVWAAGVDHGLRTKEEVLAVIPPGTWDTTPDILGDAPLGDALVPNDITLDGVIEAIPGSSELVLPLQVNGRGFGGGHYIVTEPGEVGSFFIQTHGCFSIEGCSIQLCATTDSGGNEGLATCQSTRLFISERLNCELFGNCQFQIGTRDWRVAGGPLYVTGITEEAQTWNVGDCSFTDGEDLDQVDGELWDTYLPEFSVWLRPTAPAVVDCVLSIEQ